MDRFDVNLVDTLGRTLKGEFLLSEEDCPCRLVLRGADWEMEAEDDDYFGALCQIRERVKVDGLVPHCYGASKNVYPSAMSRSMGGAIKAYRFRLGQPAKISDLVCIFDSGPDVEPVSVAQQEAFYKEWLASLG